MRWLQINALPDCFANGDCMRDSVSATSITANSEPLFPMTPEDGPTQPEDGNLKIFYGVRAISPPPWRVRVPHRRQSAEVRRLLGDLSARVAAPRPETEERSSLSHSRCIAAAAIARNGRVGIDVEYICPRRDIHGIFESFFGPMVKPVSPTAFYRAWTFGEAYFKALGRLPDTKTIARVVEHHSDEGLHRVQLSESAAVGALHSRLLDDFALTIVWQVADIASARDPTPNRILLGGFDRTGGVE